MEFKIVKIGNRYQVKTYKDGECTKVTFLKYLDALKTMRVMKEQGHKVTYTVNGAVKSFC